MIDLIEKSKKIINKKKLFSRKYYLDKLEIFLTTENILIIMGQRRV
ncbi:MAG: hypothetical protein LBD88_02210 [Candidatus Peribacteria bacterium]|jgi:hypothetical protein|nr:hypothetical protein [Candidatus Peribacteria bacterium]